MMRNPLSYIVIPISVVMASMLVFLFLVPNLNAQQHPNLPPARSTPKAVKPIYNPDTKSYFELRVDLPKPSTWQNAVRFARTKSFKGVRGRIAQVPDIKTHSFLRANFETYEEAWIGLRYFCSFRKLVWADGDEQPRRGFKMWSRKWHRTQIRCGATNIPFMPIYYTTTRNGFRWQASGPSKHFVSYFVEYPTGKE